MRRLGSMAAAIGLGLATLLLTAPGCEEKREKRVEVRREHNGQHEKEVRIEKERREDTSRRHDHD